MKDLAMPEASGTNFQAMERRSCHRNRRAKYCGTSRIVTSDREIEISASIRVAQSRQHDLAIRGESHSIGNIKAPDAEIGARTSPAAKSFVEPAVGGVAREPAVKRRISTGFADGDDLVVRLQKNRGDLVIGAVVEIVRRDSTPPESRIESPVGVVANQGEISVSQPGLEISAGDDLSIGLDEEIQSVTITSA